jgi:predicted dehydrogenase
MRGSSRHADGIGVAVIGTGLMARAHTYAYTAAPMVARLPVVAVLRVLCGRRPTVAQDRAAAWGFEDWTTDWRSAVEREDVQLVDVCTPPGAHLEVIEHAAACGKAILCEKPLAATLDDAVRASVVVAKRRVLNAVGFNYRRLPAVMLMRQLIEEGGIGEPRVWRGRWLSDEFADPTMALDWRFDRALAGSIGSDLGIHLIDLAQWMLGGVQEVVADSATFIDSRPLPDGSGTGAVSTEDTAGVLLRFTGGVRGILEMTRVAVGRPLDWLVEVEGSEGAVSFRYENLNELWLARRREDLRTGGFHRIRAEYPVHPYAERWWPPGQGIGYDASFINQVCDLFATWPEGPWRPSFAEAVRTQAVVDAIERSAASGVWVKVSDMGELPA